MLLWYHRTPRENDKVWNEPYNKKDIGNGVLFVCKKEKGTSWSISYAGRTRRTIFFMKRKILLALPSAYEENFE